MHLKIDTSQKDFIKLDIVDNDDLIKSIKVKSDRNQAEILLVNIDKFLVKNNLSIKNLSKIVVENKGASYTSLRIGVLTANALAYALNIKVEQEDKDSRFIVKHQKYQVVLPNYDNNL